MDLIAEVGTDEDEKDDDDDEVGEYDVEDDDDDDEVDEEDERAIELSLEHDGLWRKGACRNGSGAASCFVCSAPLFRVADLVLARDLLDLFDVLPATADVLVRNDVPSLPRRLLRVRLVLASWCSAFVVVVICCYYLVDVSVLIGLIDLQWLEEHKLAIEFWVLLGNKKWKIKRKTGWSK